MAFVLEQQGALHPVPQAGRGDPLPRQPGQPVEERPHQHGADDPGQVVGQQPPGGDVPAQHQRAAAQEEQRHRGPGRRSPQQGPHQSAVPGARPARPAAAEWITSTIMIASDRTVSSRRSRAVPSRATPSLPFPHIKQKPPRAPWLRADSGCPARLTASRRRPRRPCPAVSGGPAPAPGIPRR